jgi:hypothetical protein
LCYTGQYDFPSSNGWLLLSSHLQWVTFLISFVCFEGAAAQLSDEELAAFVYLLSSHDLRELAHSSESRKRYSGHDASLVEAPSVTALCAVRIDLPEHRKEQDGQISSDIPDSGRDCL